MAETLTVQQAQAVSNRGGRLLVSAAAGSGKTKVLVDRILSFLTDPAEPANLDDFLIITYTKAAASELRGKIAAKLTERIAQDPENRHLQRQMQRLYLAKISTVHAFCGDILRQYAYQLDLPGDFRVADENECRQLREETVADILEKAYDSAGEDPDFRAFVDSQGLGRDDRQVPEIILKVYDSARCHLNPQSWLQGCEDSARIPEGTDVSQTPAGQYLMEELFRFLDLQIEAMESCAAQAAESEGMEKPAALLADNVFQLRQLRDSDSWDAVVRHRKPDFGKLTFSKKCTDLELAERIKAVRNSCKKELEKRLKSFADESATVLEDLAASHRAVRGITALVRRFSESYDQCKRSRRILDFGDLEHRMLDLLLGKNRAGDTAVAREIGSRFREVMVDEYQDSNEVQDAIFMALTRQRQNCFMVGDVKQSIYQFRLADPGIFLEKYRTYADAETAEPGEGRKVLLSSNFRSGGGVIRCVNDIFAECMSPEVGGLSYTEAEALREGIPHCPLTEPEVELYAIDVQESTYDEEAAFTAERVAQLLDGSHSVRQGEGLRPIRPEDIAILLRSPGSVGETFRKALERRGIRCTTGGGEDLLQTEEIATLRAILQTVSNPRQDIPLLAALASPVFGFTADDLAAIRSKNKKCSIYEALAQDGSEKTAEFLRILEVLRREKRMQTLAQLVETVFALTRMDSLYASMEGGEVRAWNLQTFYRLAADYENSGRRDLEQFLEYLQAMEEKGLMTSSEQTVPGAVTMMSIHKSKGLEFPVVFVCGLSREFNRESLRAQVLCHKDLGLGLAAVDTKNRIRYPTAAKRAIGEKILRESLSEELRVLYVALTRAKDRLIMTYASDNLEKDVQQLALRMDLGSPLLLTGNVVCPGEWVLMAALRRTEAGELFALGGKPERTAPGEPAWLIRVVKAPEETAAVEAETEQIRLLPETVERLKQNLAFRYAHSAAAQAPSKQTATQRKGRDKDAEAAEQAAEPAHSQRIWRNVAFGTVQEDGRERGNAYHKVMQHIRCEACISLRAVEDELERLVREGFLPPEQRALVDSRRIWALFDSEMGRLLQSGAELVREFKFSVLDDGTKYDPALVGEKILLQGVVDCAVLEADGITVLDFKTDRVTKDTLPIAVERYRTQVRTYAEAMARIYGKPVKGAFLYFFHTDSFAEISLA